MVEEKVQNLIFGIKKYKTLFEAEFIKYISLPKINNINDINNKKISMNYSSLINNNNESKNITEEENNIKKYNIMHLQFNSEVINQPKYNIIKRKLFNNGRKRNKLNKSLKNNLSDIFSCIELKENKITTTKNQNKSISYLESNGKFRIISSSSHKNAISPKNRRLLKFSSHIGLKKNLFELNNKNDSIDKSSHKEVEIYSPKKLNIDSHLQNNKINLNELNTKTQKKIKLLSIPNIKLNHLQINSLINDNSKNESKNNNDVNENNIKEKEDKLFNEIKEKGINLNAVENIYNDYNYNLIKKKLYIVNGKNITFRNSLANIGNISKLNNRFSIKPIKPLNLRNDIILENSNSKE